MPQFLQPSLSGGELSPGLQGRVDVARYAVSVATMENFISKPTGGAVKRPGYRFNGKVKDAANPPRLIPFVYSTEIKYLLEVGVGYIRFWVPATPYGYALLLDTDTGLPYEVGSPYALSDLALLRYTQSADVLYLSGVNQATYSIPPKQLKRLTGTTFQLQDFPFRRGPFRSMNTDTSVRMAVTDTTGNIHVTCSSPLFTQAMVGGFLYFEEKELNDVKPWTPLERNVQVGWRRRADGKIYECVAVPDISGGGGTPYYICGNTEPLQDIGRAWDGPGDKRNDGANDYWVGVEWAFQSWSFGIVKITSFISATEVKAVVVDRVPNSIKGSVGGPSHTWNFVGDGATTTFSLTSPNNTSDNELDYTVTIAGVSVPSNPFGEPTSGPGSTGGGIIVGPRGGGDGGIQEQ